MHVVISVDLYEPLCLHIAWTDMHMQQLTGCLLPDVLQVIRIQPNESIYLKINNKVPGLGLNLDVQKLDLSYKTRYNKHLPDAYERLILDVINGDKRLFIRNDELEAAWDLFTPILKVRQSVTAFWSGKPVAAPSHQALKVISPSVEQAICGHVRCCMFYWLILARLHYQTLLIDACHPILQKQISRPRISVLLGGQW